jgi:hypothetical protein
MRDNGRDCRAIPPQRPKSEAVTLRAALKLLAELLPDQPEEEPEALTLQEAAAMPSHMSSGSVRGVAASHRRPRPAWGQRRRRFGRKHWSQAEA